MMRATKKSTNYSAQHGTTRSDSWGFISVGGIVAFATHNYCSPDGRSSGRGVNLLSAPVLYQEDLILEEYSEDTRDRALVRHDTAEVVEVPDYFLYDYYQGVSSGTFLCSVLPDETPCLDVWLTYGGQRIEQLQNGLWLHVYSLNDGAIRAVKSAKSFLHGVDLIQKAYKANEDKYNNWQGQELDYTETRSGWYKPNQGFGYWENRRQHEYDSTRTYHCKIKFAKNCPEGSYACYILGSPVTLHLKKGERPNVFLNYDGSGQNWSYGKFYETNLKPGMIWEDGIDVYEVTTEKISANLAAQKLERQEKVDKLKAELIENGWNENQIDRLMSTARGRVIITLQQATKTGKSPEMFIFNSQKLGKANDVQEVRSSLR